MAAGRAVVATAVGGLPDLVRPEETGLLVAPRNAGALAAAIVRALDQARPWGAAAARVAREHDWPAAAAAVEAVVRATVSPRRRGS